MAILPNTQPTTQLVSLTWNLNRVEDRLYQLKLRQDLFLAYCTEERLFSSLPARIQLIRQQLQEGRTQSHLSQTELEKLAATLKELETDLDLRELLQVQRSLINYLSSQREETYLFLSQRWKHLTELMISVDTLVTTNSALAAKKREELEKGLKELEGCLRNSKPYTASYRQTELAQFV